MPACRVGLSDVSLRCLSGIEPPARVAWSNLAPALEALDDAGFRTIEAWGDLTFDHSLRVLRESPWERLSALARHITRTPLQMELRGRCLLGSRPYPPALIREFMKQASGCGVRSFLVYEPLNDVAALETVALAVKEAGAGLTLGLVYSHGSPGDGESLRERAAALAGLHPQALCVKTAEAVAPGMLRRVVESVVAAARVPVEVDIDNAGGLGAAAALAAAQGGATTVYGSAAPAWLDRSAVGLPALVSLLRTEECEVGVGAEAVAAAAAALAQALSSEESLADMAVIEGNLAAADWRDVTRLPAGLAVQVIERLRALGAAGRLPEVAAEIGRVRDEIGRPTLVAPVAQLVATQAVLNVVYGKRWQMVPDEMKAYLRGEYGMPAGILAPELQEMAAGLEPASTPALTIDTELPLLPGDDVLLALAPEAAAQYVEERRAAADVDALRRPAAAREAGSDIPGRWSDLGPESLRELVSLLESSSVDELTLENGDTRVSLRKAALQAGPGAHVPAGMPPSVPAQTGAGPAGPPPVVDDSLFTVTSSMVGTFYRSPAPGVAPYVELGSRVTKGDPLCVLEAMKLMNELLSEVSGEVVGILADDGSAVEYGQPLFLVQRDQE